MAELVNAITGQASLTRKRKKAKRIAKEDFPTLPNWLKSWDRTQVQTYLDSQDFSDPAVVKALFGKVADALLIYRDVLELLEE